MDLLIVLMALVLIGWQFADRDPWDEDEEYDLISAGPTGKEVTK